VLSITDREQYWFVQISYATVL